MQIYNNVYYNTNIFYYIFKINYVVFYNNLFNS